MIQYHPATRLGQQESPMPMTPHSVPSWFKVALGTGLIAAGTIGAYSSDSRRPAAARKTTAELIGLSGSIVGGIYLLLDGLGANL